VLEGRLPGHQPANVVVHYALPTPVEMIEGSPVQRSFRARLKKVAVQGELGKFGRIDFIDVWDRHNRIFTTRGSGWGIAIPRDDQESRDFRDKWIEASLAGEHQVGNVLLLPERPIVWGAVGVSLCFSGHLDETRLLITQVAALFEI
jgi:hypothetical protein